VTPRDSCRVWPDSFLPPYRRVLPRFGACLLSAFYRFLVSWYRLVSPFLLVFFLNYVHIAYFLYILEAIATTFRQLFFRNLSYETSIPLLDRLLYKEASHLGLRGVQLFNQKLSCAPPCIIPPGKQRCRVYQRHCCEGSCVHQELSGSGLRRGDLHHVACWICSSSSGDVLHIIGRFLFG
jgi:hypothetical protein